jgi:hypothetical protein
VRRAMKLRPWEASSIRDEADARAHAVLRESNHHSENNIWLPASTLTSRHSKHQRGPDLSTGRRHAWMANPVVERAMCDTVSALETRVDQAENEIAAFRSDLQDFTVIFTSMQQQLKREVGAIRLACAKRESVSGSPGVPNSK